MRIAIHPGKAIVSATALMVLAFLLMPILVIGLYAFSDSSVQVWPITRFSTRAFGEAWNGH